MSDSLQPHGLYSPWNSPGQNTGIGSLSLLQGIFPIQRSNTGLLHCRQILYQLSQKGSPKIDNNRCNSPLLGSFETWVCLRIIQKVFEKGKKRKGKSLGPTSNLIGLRQVLGGSVYHEHAHPLHHSTSVNELETVAGDILNLSIRFIMD